MGLPDLVDDVLDRTIAPGYGSVGLVIRRRLPTWPADPPRMDGQVVLVTGAASVLGQAAAQGCARLGASLRVLGRDERRAADAARQVADAVPGADARPVSCDVSSLEELRAFTAAFAATEERLDVLINNAGVMPGERTRSADGVELTFATQVLAPWVLLDELQDLLRAGAPARVINVCSGGMYAQPLPYGDPQSQASDYSPKLFYARTKRQLMVITEQWAERLRGSGVVVHAMHPGWVDTKGVRTWMPVFHAVTRPIIRSPEQGADTIVWLCAAPEPAGCTGRFWHDRRPRPTHYRLGARDDPPEARQEVWDTCAALAGRSRTTAG